MGFFRNLFRRGEQSPTAPVPVTEDIPLDNIVGAALKDACDALMTPQDPSCASEERLDVFRRVFALQLDVFNGPSPIKGFDGVIAQAVSQIPFFCDIADGDFDQVNQYVDAIGEAIAARQLTEETCDKLGPTIECHYHRMLLISLQARLEKINRDVAEKQAYRERILALPPEEQASHQAALAALNLSIQAADIRHRHMAMCIDHYMLSYQQARQMLEFDGPLPTYDIRERMAEIDRITQSFNEALD